jgi:hypothetical protein
MKKNKSTASKLAKLALSRKKLGKIRRIFMLASGSVMLYRAIKQKNVRQGVGAGLMLFQGVRG